MGLFNKKKDKSSDDAARSGASSPAVNPYAAAAPSADPYANAPIETPYAQANAQAAYGLPQGPRGGAPSIRSQAPSYRTTAEPTTGYGAESFGTGAGYGADRYGGSAPPSRGPNGYGGLGRTNSSDTTTTEDNRAALFGAAPTRVAQQAPLPQNGQSDGYDTGANGGYNDGYGNGYGEQRELTAEEQEEEDVLATKQQIKFMKQEDVSSTRNALRIAQMAEETGRATLARLGAQGERIHNTEKNLDLAANHNRIAEEKAKELKTLNKSMFAVHVSNPFTASQRRAQRDQDVMDKHHAEKEAREETRRDLYQTTQRMDNNFRELNKAGDPGYKPKAMTKASLAERSKYQFEADSDDEEMENEIDANLDALSGAAGRLNMLARATGEEVERQNVVLDRVARKTDKVDDQIAMNRARLDRIK